MFKANDSQQELVSCCFFDHVFSNISCAYCVTCVSLFIILCHPWDFTLHTSRRGTLHLCINVFFFCTSAFVLFRQRVFCRALGSGARTQGARPCTTAHVWAPAEVRGPCSGGSKSRKLTSNHGEAFRARRAIHAHANPHGFKNVRQASHTVLLTVRIYCLATSCS